MRVAGKTHCQPHSRPAFAYLRARAPGSSTQPAPRRRSAWCCAPPALEVGSQCGLDGGWEYRQAILPPLAVTDHELVHREIDVLDSQPTALQQAQARTVQQNRHEPRDAVEALKDGANLSAGEHDRQVLGPLGSDHVLEPRELDTEHLAVEEQERAQRLILCRGGNLLPNREGREELGDLGGAHLHRMAFAVEENVRLIQWTYAFSVRRL